MASRSNRSLICYEVTTLNDFNSTNMIAIPQTTKIKDIAEVLFVTCHNLVNTERFNSMFRVTIPETTI